MRAIHVTHVLSSKLFTQNLPLYLYTSSSLAHLAFYFCFYTQLWLVYIFRSSMLFFFIILKICNPPARNPKRESCRQILIGFSCRAQQKIIIIKKRESRGELLAYIGILVSTSLFPREPGMKQKRIPRIFLIDESISPRLIPTQMSGELAYRFHLTQMFPQIYPGTHRSPDNIFAAAARFRGARYLISVLSIYMIHDTVTWLSHPSVGVCIYNGKTIFNNRCTSSEQLINDARLRDPYIYRHFIIDRRIAIIYRCD